MGEVHVNRILIKPFPMDIFIMMDIIAQFFLFWAIGHGFVSMAPHTDLKVR